MNTFKYIIVIGRFWKRIPRRATDLLTSASSFWFMSAPERIPPFAACIFPIFGIPGSGKTLLTRHLAESFPGGDLRWNLVAVNFDDFYPPDLRFREHLKQSKEVCQLILLSSTGIWPLIYLITEVTNDFQTYYSCEVNYWHKRSRHFHGLNCPLLHSCNHWQNSCTNVNQSRVARPHSALREGVWDMTIEHLVAQEFN